MNKKQSIEDIDECSGISHRRVTYTVGVKVFIIIFLITSVYLAYFVGDIIFDAWRN